MFIEFIVEIVTRVEVLHLIDLLSSMYFYYFFLVKKKIASVLESLKLFI